MEWKGKKMRNMQQQSTTVDAEEIVQQSMFAGACE